MQELEKLLKYIDKEINELVKIEKDLKPSDKATLYYVKGQLVALRNIKPKVQNILGYKCDGCKLHFDFTVPIAGSGVNVVYYCKNCIEARQIHILQEYIDKHYIRTRSL